MRVYRTECDGYYVVIDAKGRVSAYEGYALCPRKIKKMIDNGEFESKECFFYSVH